MRGTQHILERNGTRHAYRICDTDDCFAGEGGEAVVYRVTDEKGQIAILKIYDNFTQEEESNHLDVIAQMFMMWNEKKADNGSFGEHFLLPISDYGRIRITADADDLSANRDEIYAAEVLPFVNNVFPEKWSYKQLKDVLIPQLLEAVHTLHGNNILHRDIKPENLMFSGGKVYLSDYGTVRFAGNNSKINYTDRATGTPGYKAPEIDGGFATEKSDYFSLGMTIATLYNGKHVYADELNKGNIGIISHLLYENDLPLKCAPGEEPLAALTNALTLPSFDDRAGYDDVKKWLEAPGSFHHSARGHKEIDLEYGGVRYTSLKEVAAFLSENWEDGKICLYRGYLDPSDRKLKGRLEEIIEKYSDRSDVMKSDLGLALSICELDPSGPYCWRGSRFNSTAEIAGTASEALKTGKNAADLNSMLKAGCISELMKKKKEIKGSGIGADQIQTFTEIENICREGNGDLAQRILVFAYSSDPNARRYRNSGDPDELFDSLIGKDDTIREPQQILSDPDLWAFCSVGGGVDRIKSVISLKKELDPEQWLDAANGFYALGEAVLKPDGRCITRLRADYISYGPLSVVLWMKENLGMYDLSNAGLAQESARIKKAGISSGVPIGETRKTMTELRKDVDSILNGISSNLILAKEGYPETVPDRKEKRRYVIPLNQAAFPVHSSRYGLVPAGYMDYMVRKVYYETDVPLVTECSDANVMITRAVTGLRRTRTDAKKSFPWGPLLGVILAVAAAVGIIMLALLLKNVVIDVRPFLYSDEDMVESGGTVARDQVFFNFMINSWPSMLTLIIVALFPLSLAFLFFAKMLERFSGNIYLGKLDGVIKKYENYRKGINKSAKELAGTWGVKKRPKYVPVYSSEISKTGGRSNSVFHYFAKAASLISPLALAVFIILATGLTMFFSVRDEINLPWAIVDTVLLAILYLVWSFFFVQNVKEPIRSEMNRGFGNFMQVLGLAVISVAAFLGFIAFTVECVEGHWFRGLIFFAIIAGLTALLLWPIYALTEKIYD